MMNFRRVEWLWWILDALNGYDEFQMRWMSMMSFRRVEWLWWISDALNEYDEFQTRWIVMMNSDALNGYEKFQTRLHCQRQKRRLLHSFEARLIIKTI
jgi:hypothetical protein